MMLSKDDLKPVMVEERPALLVLKGDEEWCRETKEVRIVSFCLNEGFYKKLTLDLDLISVECPTKPMTKCASTIEFDARELELMFNGYLNGAAFKTACPGCRRPLGLIKEPDRTFSFGWL